MESSGLFKILRKHMIAFIVTLLVCEGGVFLVNTLAKPQYQATASLVATIASTEAGTYTEFLASQMLTKTYEDAIESRFIANEAKNKLQTKETAYELLKRIKVRTDPDTLVIIIKATHDNPQDAVAIANAFAESFIQKSKELVESSSVMILDKSNLEEASIPVSPRKILNYAIGGFIGLFAGLCVSMLLEKRGGSKRSQQRRTPREKEMEF
ncbi:YveK family protein [Paenibacillus barengoltzii]|uniref:YveK family protein n=1 Tax=Paenibacillus barengoltzii TaxID=343517 RepID=UPI000A03A148|nr:hypothetical protein [Paenibacillus barengoltzii]SMF47795.1 Capsular polysaccharide biosynthesis protein [Paenibacillus barengoltzii]